ncbi:T9SS type A sorting domain-containing protein [Gelidibacter sp. F2691]|nr:T9SS type A sorting domain-containing protein [Gelidibacter sp. F2691]
MGTLYYYVTVSGACTPPVTSSVSGAVSVNAPPAISVQPSTSPQTLCLNDAAIELSVAATGPGLSYQWYSNTVNSNSGGTSLGAGATSENYTPKTNATGTLYYYVIVTGSCSPPITSGVSGAVTVNVPPAITGQPNPSQTVCSGFPVSLSVTATGTGLTYEWFKNGSSIGVTDATLNISQATLGDIGTYTVVVKGAAPCGEVTSANAVINVNEDIEITNQPISQEICEGTSTSLSVAATGTGLSYQWRKGGKSISNGGNITGATTNTLTFTNATEGNSGSYDVVVSATDGTCPQTISKPANLKVNPNNTITLTSATNTDNQTICINTSLTEITYASTGATGASFSGLPAGITGTWENNTIKINGKPTEVGGPFNYKVTLTGGCGDVDITGTISVDPSNTIMLTSASGTNAQSVCVNTPLTDITYATTGAIGASFSGLPVGVTGTWVNNTVKISGTPTAAGGPTTYTVTLTGGCSVEPITGTINVDPTNSITLTSDSGTDAQSVCINTPLTDITYATTGATGASFSGLPAGVTGTWVNNTVKISGTPTAAGGPTTYTVTLTGGCSVEPITGTINVDQINSFTLTSASGTDAQSVCKNTPLTDITYATTGATGATFSGLPAGVTGTWVNNTVKISGIPTAAGGPTTYTVTLTGGCSVEPITGTINVDPTNTFSLTSASGTNVQSVCTDTQIKAITYATTGATGASFSGLPAGVTGTWSDNVVSISGKPTEVGSFNYTVTLTGGCSGEKPKGTITVKPSNTITLTSASGTNAQSVCINSPLTDITYATTGATGATFSGLPAGVTGTWVNNTVKISGTPTAAGGPTTYTITLTGGCSVDPITGTIKIDPKPVGGDLTWSNNERVYLTCEEPTNNFDEVLTLQNQIGNIIQWEYRTVSDLNWSIYNSQNSTLTASDFASILSSNVETTVFRAKLANGACNADVYSKTAILSVIPSDIKPTPVEADPEVLCVGASVSLSSSTGYGQEYGQFEGGDYTNTGIKNHGWDFTDYNGKDTDFNAGINNGRANHWSKMNASGGPNGTVYTGNLPIAATGSTIRWTTRSGVNEKFALVTGNNDSYMETPVFSLGALDEAILTFDQAYNLTTGATISVELSLDSGNPGTYNIVLFTITSDGSTTIGSSGNYTDFGGGTPSSRPKNKMVIDLGDYLGQPNLRVRFNFNGVRDGDVWAVDNIKVPDGPRDVLTQWFYDDDPNDPNNPLVPVGQNNQTTVTFTPTKIGLNSFEVKTALILDSKGDPCEQINNSETISIYVFDNYTSTATAPPVAACGKNNFQLEAGVIATSHGGDVSFPTLDGYGAPFWEVVGADATGYSFVNPNTSDTSNPINNPNAIFVAPNEGTYTLRWTMSRNVSDGRVNDCPIIYKPIEINVKNCVALDFDGKDDFVDLGDYTGDYSIEAWIRPKASTGTIISTKNREINMSDLPGVSPGGRWYHIAVDSSGKLYLDGIDTGTTISTTGTSRSFIGAKWSPPNATNFFSGWIEEVRIWNGNISQEQIRFLMNQRLQPGPNIGVEIPMPAPGLPYTSLVGYYKLLSNNILNGGYTPNLAGTVNGKLRNMTTLQENTAPLPYTSKVAGKWDAKSTWTHSDVWDVPNSTGINGAPIEWNIVRTSHDVTYTPRLAREHLTLLGLLVDENELTITGTGADDETNNGTGLWITHYLKINGKIDLVGESQLVQKRYGHYDGSGNFFTTQISESIFDNTSTGILERDQQGTSNAFNYNYWGSPVAPGNASSSFNNDPPNTFNLDGILRAGTNTVSDPFKDAKIKWITGHTPNPVSIDNAVELTSRWLYTYYGATNTYSEWDRINETSAIKIGLGYSMKGSGNSTPKQNYVFVGKPNNGTITNTVASGNDILLGNPYPSAIDANAFIIDNGPSILNGTATKLEDGALSFWEHYVSNDTHIFRDYDGGYATYNLVGGQFATTPPITSDFYDIIIKTNGITLPGRYIPVGQGFFVTSSASGGDIIFQNSQRIFKREASEESVFFRGENNTSENVQQKTFGTEEIEIQRVRLTFKTPEGAIRPLLLGFTPDNAATDGVDYGYDAFNKDAFPSDLSFSIAEKKFVIQGVGAFNVTKKYPFAMQLAKSGGVEFGLEELENFTDAIDVYIYDSLLGTYHQINDTSFAITLEAGNYDKRFYLTFKDDKTLEIIDEDFKNVVVKFLQNTDEIFIQTPNEVHVKQVYLVNIIGQTVQAWNATNTTISNEMKIPVRNLPDGNYVIKIQTDSGIVNKKIVLKF